MELFLAMTLLIFCSKPGNPREGGERGRVPSEAGQPASIYIYIYIFI